MIRPTTPKLTHKQLVEKTKRWLYAEHPRDIIVVEPTTKHGGESCDVMRGSGWRNTYVYECKVSRSDSIAEGKKKHKQTGRACGRWRYIVSPVGVEVVVPEGYGHILLHPEGGFEERDIAYAHAEPTIDRDREWELIAQAFRNMKRASGVDVDEARPGRVQKLNDEQRKHIVESLAEFGYPIPVSDLARDMPPGAYKTKTKRINAILFDLHGGLIDRARAKVDGGLTYAELTD